MRLPVNPSRRGLAFRLLICAACAASRLVELMWSRRNIATIGPTREGVWSRRTFPLMVGMHSAVILGTAVKGGRRPRMTWLALLLLAQPLRIWSLATLGRRWN